MRENGSNTKSAVLGFLAGGIIGGSIALLYAPKTGREMRKQINKKKNEMINDAGEYIDIAKTKVVDMYSDGRDKVLDIISTGRETINEGTGKIKTAVLAGVGAFTDGASSNHRRNHRRTHTAAHSHAHKS